MNCHANTDTLPVSAYPLVADNDQYVDPVFMSSNHFSVLVFNLSYLFVSTYDNSFSVFCIIFFHMKVRL